MKVLKVSIQVLAILLGCIIVFAVFFKKGLILDHLGIHLDNPFVSEVKIPDEYATTDHNHNGIADPIDIVNAARKEVRQRTAYRSVYYDGGFPPEGEGVCTDVVWRGFSGADISLKTLIDADIADNTELYPRVKGKPDPNIDFRRVPNLNVFFQRYAKELTTKIESGNIENLRQWQAGDIVVWLDGFQHVGIISDRRTKEGIPYLIHNTYPFAAEVKLSSISTPIAGHYRWLF
jgi:uncharacterized protein YijF (DUF1287 family)